MTPYGTTPPIDANPKTARGSLKPDLSTVPPIAEVYLGKAMDIGSKRYGPFNWRDDPVSASVYIAAIKRHLFAWQDGEDFDPVDTHHLGHIMACCAILLDAQHIGTLNDDRPKGGHTALVIRQMTNPG